MLSVLISLITLSSTLGVLAVQEVGAQSTCPIVGAACSYTYSSTDGDPTVVNGFCAPNNYCSDNGAKCTLSSQCYNDCGVDGICGGIGTTCDTTEPFAHNQSLVACFTPEDVCTGRAVARTCVKASNSSTSRSKRDLPKKIARTSRLQDACSVDTPGMEFCQVFTAMGTQSSCLDTTVTAQNCGGCVTNADGSKGDGKDCGKLDGAESSECVDSKCLATSCDEGYTLVDSRCQPDHDQ